MGKKSVLNCIICFFVAFCLIGCTKSNEKIEEVFNSNGFKITISKDLDSCSVLNNGKIGWMYFKEHDHYYYADLTIDSSASAINVDTDKPENLLNGQEDQSVSNQIVKKLIQSNDSQISKLKLSLDEIKSLLKFKLDYAIKEYDKLSSKEKLIKNFDDKSNEINNLSDSDADKYLDCYKNNKKFTFSEIQEYVFINNSSSQRDVVRIINNLKIVSMNNKKWSLNNFEHLRADENTAGIRYDFYFNNKDTNIDLTIMYDPSTNEFKGVGFKSNTNINEMDSKDFIAICAIISSNVDESLKNNDKQSLKNIIECFESAITYNGYVYFIDTNDGITFMIYPKGSF